jgi:PKHD-type hydroxylase
MISNDPFFKRRITHNYVSWSNTFSDQEITNIQNLCEKEEFDKAATVDKGEDCDNHRRSKVKFFDKNEDNFWIFDKFNNVIDTINNQFYDFDLYGYKNFQYTIYDSSNNGMYDWHMDTILSKVPNDMLSGSTRKLSLVMLLSQPYEEFTGGEFQFNGSMEKYAITPTFNKGDIIVFPSFMIHRVKPVLLGIRKSIVIWVEGPKFR